MRNYFALKAIWVHGQAGPATAELVAFAADDDGLREWIQPMIDEQRETFPNMVFTYFGPHKVWFELNEENFVNLLNGPRPLHGSYYAYDVYLNTRLQPPPGVPANAGDFFWDMTTIEVQGSPRKTWSHGH